jgi:alpha-ketoglutarate-dependent taurine dioxygenase
LFGAGHQVHAGWIDDVTDRESEIIKAYCEYHPEPKYPLQYATNPKQVLELIAQNHDLQVRFKWRKNDVAIWDK